MGRVEISVDQALLKGLLSQPGSFSVEQKRWQHCADQYNAKKGANYIEISPAVVRLRAIAWGLKAAPTAPMAPATKAPAASVAPVAQATAPTSLLLAPMIRIPAGEAPVKLKSDSNDDLRSWIQDVLAHERSKGRRLSEHALTYWATHIGGLAKLQEISSPNLEKLRERIRTIMVEQGWAVSTP